MTQKISLIDRGQVLTAERQNKIAGAINAGAKAIAGPKEVRQIAEKLADNSQQTDIGDEVFTAQSLTEVAVNATDSNGDTVPLHNVTKLVCTEDKTGRSMTITIPSGLFTA